MNDRLYIATLESRNFGFEGVGTTDVEAVNVLIQGLRSHGDQCGISWTWWYEDDMRAAAEDGKPVAHVEEPRRLIDDMVVQLRTIERGQPYRDGQPIPFQPTFEECGCCGHYHRPNYFGDCRNDAERFSANDLDDRYGEGQWIAHDLDEQNERYSEEGQAVRAEIADAEERGDSDAVHDAESRLVDLKLDGPMPVDSKGCPEPVRRVEQRRGGWFVIDSEWSGPWKTEAAANLAMAGDYDGAHALERKA